MKLYWIGALAVLFWCSVSIGRAAETGAEHLFGDSIGLGVKFAQGQPLSDLPRLSELGVRWVRDGVLWTDIEPVAHQYKDFPADFKTRLQYYASHNIGIDFLLCYGNSKAYPDTADNKFNSVNSVAFGGYAAHVARLLKAAGVRFTLEIWNEPHNFVLAKKLGGQWQGKAPSPWVDQYCAMAAEAVKQVKAFDPAIPLMSQDDTWIISYWFLDKGLPKTLDAMSVHPYWGNTTGPESSPVWPCVDWCQPFNVIDEDQSAQSAILRLRDQGQVKLGHTPAIWATEEGIPVGEKRSNPGLTKDGKLTEDGVAAFIPRTFISNAWAGVEATFWFSSYDGPDGPYGLERNDTIKRKGFDALKTMTGLLGKSRIVAHLIGDDHRTKGVQAYLFRGSDGDKIAIWDISEVRDISVKVGGSHLHCEDIFGNPVAVKVDSSGTAILRLSPTPLYITSAPAILTTSLMTPVQTGPTLSYLFP